MTKLQWIMLLLGSNLPIGAQLLRNKDVDSVGSDDVAADLLDYTGEVLRALQFKLPIPDIPKSLRDSIDGSSDTTTPIVSSAT